MKKIKVSALSFSICLAVGVALTGLLALAYTYFSPPRDGGPLDLNPRFESSALSPDGALTVRVYRQRVSYPPNSKIDVIVKVLDRRENVLYEKVVITEGAWSELNGLFTNIIFEGSQIRVGPSFSHREYHVIERSNLKAPVSD